MAGVPTILPSAELEPFNTLQLDQITTEQDHAAEEMRRRDQQMEQERQQREAQAKSLALFDRVATPEPASVETILAPDPGPVDVPIPPEARPGQGRFSPFDDIFRPHMGPHADNPELMSIIAAATKAESGWRTDAVGDAGASVGLFQMHERGAGAGMTREQRADPNTAAAKMVPQFVQAYDRIKAANPNLSGAELASLVAATVERPQDWQNPASHARNNYRRAHAEVMNGSGVESHYVPVADARSPEVAPAVFTQNLVQLAELTGQPMTVESYNHQRLQQIMDEQDSQIRVPGGGALGGSEINPTQPRFVSNTQQTDDLGMPMRPLSEARGSSISFPLPGSEPEIAPYQAPRRQTPTEARGGADTMPSSLGLNAPPMGPVGPRTGMGGDTQLRPPETGMGPADPLNYLQTRMANSPPENPARGIVETAGSIPGAAFGRTQDMIHEQTQNLRNVPGVAGANDALDIPILPMVGGPFGQVAETTLRGAGVQTPTTRPLDMLEMAAQVSLGNPESAGYRSAMSAAPTIGQSLGRAAERLVPDLPAGIAPRAEPFFAAGGGGIGDDLTRQVEQLAADASAVNPVVPEDMGKLVPNLERLDVGDDLKATLIRIAEENRDRMQTAQRGTVSWEETQRAAQVLGMSTDDFLKSKMGSWNEVEITALRSTMVGKFDQASQTATRIAELGDGSVAEGVKSMTEAEKVGAMNELVDLARLEAISIGAKATAGRTLNALKIDINTAMGRGAMAREGALPGEQERMAQKLLSKWVAADGELITDKMLTNFLEVIRSGDHVAAARFLRGLNDPGWWSRIQALRYGSMLSSTVTQSVQALSNTLNLGTAVANQIVMSGIEAAPRPSGQRAVNMAETMPMLVGMRQGALSGFKGVSDILKHGVTRTDLSRFDVPMGFGAEHIHFGKVYPFQGKAADALDFAVEAPSRFMMAGDWVVRSMATQGRMVQLATRQAIGEGLSGPARLERASYILQNQDQFPRLMADAEKFGKKAVFQEERGLTQRLLGLRSVAGKAGEVAFPFVRTPVNVVSQGFENSPLGFFRLLHDVPEYRKAVAAREAATGSDAAGAMRQEMASREQILDTAGHALLGTGLTAVGYGLMSMGLITGLPPKSPAERNVLPPGWQPWAVKVGDRYVSFANIGPASIPLAIGVILGSLYRDKDKDGKSEIDPFLLVRASKIVTQQTMLQSLDTYLNAIENPERWFEMVTENIAGTFAPYGALTRQIERAMGMSPRDPNGALEAIEANLPMLSQNVKPRLNVAGEPESHQLSGPLAFVSPLRVTEAQDRPWLKELRDKDITVSTPARTRDGKQLPADQYFTLKQETGQNTATAASRAMELPAYRRANPDQQKRLMETAINEGRETARREVGIYPERRADQPWKYVGVTDVKKEQQIDDIVTKYNAWIAAGRRTAPPLTGAEMSQARMYSERISPRYRQWAQQNRIAGYGVRQEVDRAVGVGR